MLDHNHQPWLIEVNTNPCLEETSQLLKTYLPRMLDDAFKLTVDVVFPRARPESIMGESNSTQATITLNPFPIIPYSDSENLWK